jgi:F0F1-type ATP synthase assembly protein I
VSQYEPSERKILGATVGLLGGLLGGLLVGAFLDRFDHPAYVPGKLALSIIWAIVGIFAGVACYTRRTS